jgi:hypothetical protein
VATHQEGSTGFSARTPRGRIGEPEEIASIAGVSRLPGLKLYHLQTI